MRRFLASITLGMALVGLAACTGNTGSANLIPKTTSGLDAMPAGLDAMPASIDAYAASHSAKPQSLAAMPI
jgi:ABC-type glycerol-3-phosphate transport system substrate-binding protein